MYEKLEAFTSVKEVDYQLDQMQRKIMNLKSAFETIDVVEIFTKKVKVIFGICIVTTDLFGHRLQYQSVIIQINQGIKFLAPQV